MDFKKFIADAGTSLNRVVQMTQENLGNVEKTQYDADVENLMELTDATQKWTQKLVEHMEAYLQPNPALRMEEFLADKLEKKVDRSKPADDLGNTMQSASQEIGTNSGYGDALQQVGRAHNRLANAEKQFIVNVTEKFLKPLKEFLATDMHTIQKERSILENCRLDLDCAKNKLRKVMTDASKKANDEAVKKAENELHNVQAVFTKQLESTRLLMEGIRAAHAHHLQCLNDYVDVALAYENQRTHYLKELQENLKAQRP